MNHRTICAGFVLVLAICFVSAGPLVADDGPGSAFGARAGLGLEPDQFVIGPQAVFGEVFHFMRFAPGIDFGFGDNVTTYSLDADLRLSLFQLPGSQANVYLDAGPTFAYFDPDKGDSDSEIGANLAAGLALPMGSSSSYNVEARLGFGDITEVRLLIGVYWGSGAPGAGGRPSGEADGQ